MPKLALRVSGLCKWSEMGRTRPQSGGQTGPTNAAAGGKLGPPGALNAAKTSGQVGLAGVRVFVRKVLPSKFSESRTTLLKARTVLSANEALKSVFGPHGA